MIGVCLSDRSGNDRCLSDWSGNDRCLSVWQVK